LSLFGDAFVEAVPDAALLAIAKRNLRKRDGHYESFVPGRSKLVCQPAQGITEPNNLDDINTFTSFAGIKSSAARPHHRGGKSGPSDLRKIGGTDCHVETMTTAPAGTAIHGGAYILSAAIVGKQFHPFGDFLLHDVGTGDGIVENGPPDTQYKVRTMPLWGLRTRTQFMHDASVGSYSEAIARHRGEAADDVSEFTRPQSGSENAASSIPWIAIDGAH
jgi:CxxC motif-containing protein (DUF1111 family)